MATGRLCDRCTVRISDGAGSVLVLQDAAFDSIEDYDETAPGQITLDLCGACRTDLAEFLRLPTIRGRLVDASTDIEPD